MGRKPISKRKLKEEPINARLATEFANIVKEVAVNRSSHALGTSDDPFDQVWLGRYGEYSFEDVHYIYNRVQQELDLAAVLLALVRTRPDHRSPRRSNEERAEIALAALLGRSPRTGKKWKDDEAFLDKLALALFVKTTTVESGSEVKISRIISSLYDGWNELSEDKQSSEYRRIFKNLINNLDERIIRLTASNGELEKSGSKCYDIVVSALADAGLLEPPEKPSK